MLLAALEDRRHHRQHLRGGAVREDLALRRRRAVEQRAVGVDHAVDDARLVIHAVVAERRECRGDLQRRDREPVAVRDRGELDVAPLGAVAQHPGLLAG